MRYLLIITAVLLAIAGCGKKGKLIPPQTFNTAPVNNLKVAQKGDNFQISWSIPYHNEEGSALTDLAGFRLFRRTVLPPSEDCETCSDAYQVVKEVDLDYLRDARRLGNNLYVTDAGVIAGTTYQYKVITLMKDGTSSEESNKFRLAKITPIPGPMLKALPTPTSIVLHWESMTVPATVKEKGYNIYRWRANDLPALVPLNSAPLLANDYEDLRLERGVSYVYSVRVVVEAAGASFESVASNQARAAMSEPD